MDVNDKKKIILSERSEDVPMITKCWYYIARNGVKTPDQLKEFADMLFGDYIHTYETTVYAISAIATAAAWMGSHIEGITGFQASCVSMEFLKAWGFKNNETGFKIVDYDYMLYPQYDYKFEKVISKDIWEKLQETAKKNLKKIGTPGMVTVDPEVKKHWESIAAGNIPFGYCLKPD